jgi:hypothetical protein
MHNICIEMDVMPPSRLARTSFIGTVIVPFYEAKKVRVTCVHMKTKG